MVSEREIEAAREVLERRVFDEGGCEAQQVPAMVREMLEAAALTTEPAAPEGQQEPMPRNVIWFGFDENTGEFTGEYCSVKPADARGMRPYIPYTARPSEQAVTEAMVEALKRIRDTAMEHTLAARIPESGVFGGIAQDADWLLSELTAAQEAGR